LLLPVWNDWQFCFEKTSHKCESCEIHETACLVHFVYLFRAVLFRCAN
jgi:hypothetical protein